MIGNKMKYKCKYIGGGGTEYNGGIWEKKETPKTISFKLVEDSFYSPCYKKIIINKFYRKNKEEARKDNNYNAFRDFGTHIGWMNNGHLLRDWKDGTYTAYPNQCGTPYIFEPIS